MNSKKYTDEQFIEVVKSSFSIGSVISKLGMSVSGGNYQTFKDNVTRLNLDTSHFTGKGFNKGKVFGFKKPIECYLSNQARIKSHDLRLRLIKEGLKKEECEICKRCEWEGQPLPLELDHINGNHLDNKLENLRILCPNCHAQTPTHRGKNQQRAKEKAAYLLANPKFESLKKGQMHCKCGKAITSHSTSCRSCVQKPTKIAWPSKEELERLVWEQPRSTLAESFGVSDKAIAKHCESLEIAMPPRGYWAKKYANKI